MGKKRVAVIGDVFEEELTRKKRAIKREQKAIRKGEKITSDEQTKVDEIKEIKQLKKQTHQDDKSKSAKVSGMKGGERVIDTSDQALEELQKIKQKEAELEQALQSNDSQEPTKKHATKRIRSNKYKKGKKIISENQKYPIDKAIELLRKTDLTKFDSTIELHINLTKQEVFNNQVVEIPHGTGNNKKVAIVDDKILKQLDDNQIDFDILLAKPSDMSKLVKYAKILGPKGLMPNPKNGTIVEKPKDKVKEFSSDNRLELKIEKKAPLIHTVVGKLSMKDIQIIDNINKIIATVGKKFIQKAYLTTTMSPSVKLDIS